MLTSIIICGSEIESLEDIQFQFQQPLKAMSNDILCPALVEVLMKIFGVLLNSNQGLEHLMLPWIVPCHRSLLACNQGGLAGLVDL